MSASNWIAIIVPLVGLVGGAIVYALQKHIDRETEIKRERRQLYRNAAIMLERLSQQLRAEEVDVQARKDALQELEITIAEVQVACPDSVADAWNEIPEKVTSLIRSKPKNMDKDSLARFAIALVEYRQVRAAALQAMRKDTYGDTKVTLEKLISAMTEIGNVMVDPRLAVSLGQALGRLSKR